MQKIAVTLDRKTISDLDRWVREGKYPNRSQALQSAVDMLSERDWRASWHPVRGREQAGLRPVVVLSNELFNRRSETAIVMAITSQPQRAGFPLTIELPENTLPKPSWLKISQVRTVSVDRLGKRIAGLECVRLSRALDCLLELIG